MVKIKALTLKIANFDKALKAKSLAFSDSGHSMDFNEAIGYALTLSIKIHKRITNPINLSI